MISTIRLKRQDTCGLLRARITQVVGECIVEFTGVDVCRIEVAELYVEESRQGRLLCGGVVHCGMGDH